MTHEQLKAMSLRIKGRREILGFKQEQFAELIELSASSYTKIENAFQKPSLDTIIKIALKLRVSLDYIIFGDEKWCEPMAPDVAAAILEFADPEALAHTREILSKLIRLKSE